MNYIAHYDRLIERSRGRVLVGYKERHHVIPKCMGGGDEAGNIVELTGREHWFAHKLLVVMHPKNRKLVYAAVWMSKRTGNGRVYEWLRKRHAASHQGKIVSLETRAKLSVAQLGRKLTSEAKEKISAANKGKRLSPEHISKLRGRKCSPETLMKMSMKKLSPEHRAKIGAKSKGRSPSLETRKKIGAARRGQKASVETREKMSVARLGNTYGKGGLGRKLSPEHCAKIAEANRHRIYSPGTLAKMSAANIGKVASSETRAKMSALRRGKKQTPEHIANSAAARRGLRMSLEARENMSIAQRKRDPKTRHQFNVVAYFGVA